MVRSARILRFNRWVSNCSSPSAAKVQIDQDRNSDLFRTEHGAFSVAPGSCPQRYHGCAIVFPGSTGPGPLDGTSLFEGAPGGAVRGNIADSASLPFSWPDRAYRSLSTIGAAQSPPTALPISVPPDLVRLSV